MVMVFFNGGYSHNVYATDEVAKNTATTAIIHVSILVMKGSFDFRAIDFIIYTS